jgi:hypothetical protein
VHRLVDAVVVICAASCFAFVVNNDRKQAATQSTDTQEIARLGKVKVDEKTLVMALSGECPELRGK